MQETNELFRETLDTLKEHISNITSVMRDDKRMSGQKFARVNQFKTMGDLKAEKFEQLIEENNSRLDWHMSVKINNSFYKLKNVEIGWPIEQVREEYARAKFTEYMSRFDRGYSSFNLVHGDDGTFYIIDKGEPNKNGSYTAPPKRIPIDTSDLEENLYFSLPTGELQEMHLKADKSNGETFKVETQPFWIKYSSEKTNEREVIEAKHEIANGIVKKEKYVNNNNEKVVLEEGIYQGNKLTKQKTATAIKDGDTYSTSTEIVDVIKKTKETINTKGEPNLDLQGLLQSMEKEGNAPTVNH